MIHRLVVSVAALLASATHAQQWVQLSDQLAFDKPPPIWCNADRSACILSKQAYGATGAVRIALTVAGTPDCKLRRPRYIFYKRNGEMDGDQSRVQEQMGSSCILDIPMTQVEGMKMLRFSVPMLTQDAVVMELSLEGFDTSRLGAFRP